METSLYHSSRLSSSFSYHFKDQNQNTDVFQWPLRPQIPHLSYMVKISDRRRNQLSFPFWERGPRPSVKATQVIWAGWGTGYNPQEPFWEQNYGKVRLEKRDPSRALQLFPCELVSCNRKKAHHSSPQEEEGRKPAFTGKCITCPYRNVSDDQSLEETLHWKGLVPLLGFTAPQKIC